jgi:ketosteroid isomerase-like protein
MEDLRDLRALLNRVTKRVDTDVRKLEAKIDKVIKLPDMMEIENLMKNMVWAIDLGDKDLWLSIWSDDINYTVPQANIDIKGKKSLGEFGERSIFAEEKKRFTTLSNTVIEVTGNTATGKDYFTHYGYPINPKTGEVHEERAISEGMHHYKFRKGEDDGWKITKFEVYIHRREEPASKK